MQNQAGLRVKILKKSIITITSIVLSVVVVSVGLFGGIMVLLSNLSPNDKISVTAIGARLLTSK